MKCDLLQSNPDYRLKNEIDEQELRSYIIKFCPVIESLNKY